jgi:acyl-CoA thioesterase I
MSGAGAAQVPAAPPAAQGAPAPQQPQPVPVPSAGGPGPGPTATTAPPPLSPSCDAPATDIAATAPLPNVAKAIAEHKTLEILAVGSASMETIGSANGVKSYPVQIEDLLKAALKGVDVDIINRGTGGEVAQTSSDRIHSEVGLTKPDLVLWQLGTNDALARVDPEQFTEVVKSTIDWLKGQGIDVVLVGLQYTSRFARDENYFAIKRALDRIAKEENILYIKRYDAMKFIAQTRAKVNLMTSDNYHLSELGTQCMAEHVAHAMVASIFVRRFRPAAKPPATTSN